MTAIKTRPVHGYSKFLSTGSARGSRVVTNKEMCTLIDSTPEWIEQRTGITERRWATNSETVASMGTTAARTCLLYTSPSPRDRQKSRMPSSA